MNPLLYKMILIPPPYWVAMLVAAAIAIAAVGMRLLTRNGGIAAFLVGMVVFGCGGFAFAIPLLLFFLSSSLLSRLPTSPEAARAPVTKGATRDAAQVAANGGPATLAVLAYSLALHTTHAYAARTLLMLYLAALASVTADTWATELGKRFGGAPLSLRTGKRGLPGDSGAMTLVGTLASLCGALVIPLSITFLWKMDGVEFFAVAWSGLVGAALDSVLGAGLQGRFKDAATGAPTELRGDRSHPNPCTGGLPWMDNDMVNLLAGLGAVLFAWCLLHIGSPFR